jgi:hypothetical protein
MYAFLVEVEVPEELKIRGHEAICHWYHKRGTRFDGPRRSEKPGYRLEQFPFGPGQPEALHSDGETIQSALYRAGKFIDETLETLGRRPDARTGDPFFIRIGMHNDQPIRGTIGSAPSPQA